MTRSKTMPSELAQRCLRTLGLLVTVLLAHVDHVKAQSPSNRFLITPINESRFTGTVEAIGSNGDFVIETPERRTIRHDELVSLQRDQIRRQSSPSSAQVVLANGDRIRASLLSSDDESLRANSELLGALSLPLEQLKAILLQPPESQEEREKLIARLKAASTDHDVVVFTNGDQTVGTFVGMDRTSIQFELQQGEVSMARDGVSAIALSDELIDFPLPVRPYSVLTLSDHSTITTAQIELSERDLKIKLPSDVSLSISMQQVIGMDLFHKRILYLSELVPVKTDHEPFFDVSYEPTFDRSLLGQSIRLDGSLFKRGIAMHSRSRVEFEIPKGFDRFESWIGLDDHTDDRGSVELRVEADGQAIWSNPIMRGADKAQFISIEIGRCKRLSLVVDFADQADVLDHASWGSARIVKTPVRN